jgi:uncharacterized Fe-S cluster-containing radical SAM superfamily enzyme
MAQKPYKMNWDKFDTACKYARNGGAQNVIITSQGEPTLYPLKIIEMLDKLKPYGFSIVELQTNGNLLASESYNDYLSSWHNKGLNKILLSVLSIDSEINSRIMGMPYYNIEDNVKKLHDFGYSIRLSCMMFKDGIDSAESLEEVIGFAKKNKVEQLAVRHVTKHFNAKNSNNELSWVNAHELSQEKKTRFEDILKKMARG